MSSYAIRHLLHALLLLASCDAPPTATAPAPSVEPPPPEDNNVEENAIPIACNDTTISTIGTRLTDADGTPTPDSGASLTFANGVFVVDYVTPPTVRQQKPGDEVQVCLIWRPTDCPPGDDRGKTYRIFDYQRKEAYVMADASHMCGGA